MKKNLMKKQNWIILGAGILTTYLGFGLMIPITRNYDGLYAFFSILTTVLGLVIVVLGLSIGFETKEDEMAE